MFVPPKPVPQAGGRAEKYSHEVINNSSLRPEDTPESYLARMLELYLGKEQQDFLRALDAIARIGWYGMEALDAYTQNKDLHSSAKALYPPDLNRGISERYNLNIKDKAENKFENKQQVVLDRDRANEVIIICNTAAYSLKGRNPDASEEFNRVARSIGEPFNPEPIFYSGFHLVYATADLLDIYLPRETISFLEVYERNAQLPSTSTESSS